MGIKDYANILKWAIKTQIEYVQEEMEKPYADENYYSGVINGLQIALDKIEASMFLARD